MGGRAGLDYLSIRVVEKRIGIKLGKVGFSILQVLEETMLKNDKKESKDG